MPSAAIANSGVITQCATKLVEKISDAVGGIAQPGRTANSASAEEKAAVAWANARIQMSALEERALQRLIREEGRRQEIIETITARATEFLVANANPEALDDDWISNFFEKARLSSATEHQEMWARILAGEANAPGSVSKHAIELVSEMSRTDALAFQKLLSHSWDFRGERLLILSTNTNRVITVENLIKTDEAQHLSDLGLIDLNRTEDFWRAGISESTVQLTYFGKAVRLGLVRGGQGYQFGLPVGNAGFSAIGRELASCLEGQYFGEVFDRTLEYLRSRGVKVYQA